MFMKTFDPGGLSVPAPELYRRYTVTVKKKNLTSRRKRQTVNCLFHGETTRKWKFPGENCLAFLCENDYHSLGSGKVKL